MKGKYDKRLIAITILAASAFFFIMGFMFPLLLTGFGIGPFTIKSDSVYLHTSFNYFFEKGEVFIGFLLLFFTIIFPVLKYIFIFLTLLGKKFPRHGAVATVLEIINKWSMLDVFVVAVLLLNLKFDTRIIVSRLGSGTTLFAISVLLLMISSLITKKIVAEQNTVKSS